MLDLLNQLLGSLSLGQMMNSCSIHMVQLIDVVDHLVAVQLCVDDGLSLCLCLGLSCRLPMVRTKTTNLVH